VQAGREGKITAGVQSASQGDMKTRNREPGSREPEKGKAGRKARNGREKDRRGGKPGGRQIGRRQEKGEGEDQASKYANPGEHRRKSTRQCQGRGPR